MGELQAEYGDRVAFNIVPAEETMRSQAAIEEFGFTAQKHGLVVFSSAGEPVVKLAGHEFGKEEIRAGIESVLGAE